MELAAEVVDGPEQQAQHNAEQDGGCERKGEGPSAASPVEVAGQTTEGNIHAREGKHHETCDDEGDSQEDEDAA